MEKALDETLSRAAVPAIVGLVTDPESTIYIGAAGRAHTGSPFAIMSMTKPVTSVAIMRLIEHGSIDLDSPATEYLPACADLKVATDVNFETGEYTAADQESPFTIRQLLNHTAGFGYAFGNPVLAATGADSDVAILCHQPGEQWTYGASTRVLGDIVSAITGKELGEALADLVFTPLGMSATSFDLHEDQVEVCNLTSGGWEPGNRYPYMPYGDGGLISTAEDYARFVRCLLNRGAPLLSAETFDEMTRNQIGDLTIQLVDSLKPRVNLPFPRGANVDKWGLGFQLHGAPPAGMRSPGSFSWCGLLNTYFWCDPVKEIGAILLMQSLPFYSEACLAELDNFEQRLYAI